MVYILPERLALVRPDQASQPCRARKNKKKKTRGPKKRVSEKREKGFSLAKLDLALNAPGAKLRRI